jgi:hypothetical protein
MVTFRKDGTPLPVCSTSRAPAMAGRQRGEERFHGHSDRSNREVRLGEERRQPPWFAGRVGHNEERRQETQYRVREELGREDGAAVRGGRFGGRGRGPFRGGAK